MASKPEGRDLSPEKMDQMTPADRSRLNSFEDLPGFVSLKTFFIRPSFVNTYKMDTAFLRRFYRGRTRLARQCFQIRVFVLLLRDMTPEEKSRHVDPLMDMLEGLMAGHRRHLSASGCLCHLDWSDCAMTFVPLCVELLRGDEVRKLVRFVANVLRTIPVKLETLLKCMNTKSVDHLLTGFSDERFETCGIRKTDFLMNSLLKSENMLSALLLRHGFKYSFHPDYYYDCREKLFATSNNPRGPNYALFQDTGNLRKQLAMEIFDYLLKSIKRIREKKSVTCNHLCEYQELLCTLWQSLPDPFITPDELYHLMDPFFWSSVLEEACAQYRELFPGVSQVKQPRSLKHLARVQTRESMVQAHSLGEKAVRSLGLPKQIEEYLWWKLEAF